MRVSIKNHDISKHEIAFRARCTELRNAAIQALSKVSSSAQVIVHAHRSLGESDFGHLASILSRVEILNRRNVVQVGSIADLHIGPLPHSDPRFSHRRFSDTFIVTAPQHPNEQKKFWRKIFDAKMNLTRASHRSASEPNIVFMRLHYSASMAALEKRARELLDEDPECRVHAVWLYQPSVVRKEGRTQVIHCFKMANHSKYDASQYRVCMEAPYGLVSTEPSQFELKSSGGSAYSLDDRYVYQRGDHYVNATVTNSQTVVDLSSPARGIRTHLDLTRGEQPVSIRGKFPQEEELVIL